MFNYFKKQHNLLPPEKHFSYVFVIEHKDTLAEIVEICLQKSLPTSDKLTINNHMYKETRKTTKSDFKIQKYNLSMTIQ